MFKHYVFLEGPTNLLGSNNSYFIFNSGKLIDKNGNEVQVQIDSHGHKIVTCSGWDGYREYRLIDLMALQFKGLRIPLKEYSKIEAFCCDGDKTNTHASNIGYRFKGGLLEHPEFKGFYYIPGYPTLVINKLGLGISLNNLKPVSFYPSKGSKNKNITGGYLHCCIKLFNRSVPIQQHRLIGLVFKVFPDNVDNLVINHIDSNTSNNNPDNIEWVTRGENNEHARENGLRSQNKPVLVRNVHTDIITEFRSIGNCAKKLGLSSTETIHYRLTKCAFGQVFKDGLQFKFKSDPRTWGPSDTFEEDLYKKQTDIMAKNEITGEIILADSCALMSEVLNLDQKQIRRAAHSRGNKLYKGYRFRLGHTNESWPFTNTSQY